jgi:2-isopropylmalate synthase
MDSVKLYDTTLRDGLGTPGLSLSVSERLKVVRELDRLGVQFIEAGFPSSNPKEVELFGHLAELELQQATICAFGMTRRRGIPAEEDEGLRTLIECFAPVVTLVGKSWSLHLEKVIRVSREENLAMISDSVAFCRAAGKRVVYDAEHFFDGYRDDRGYALECVAAAAEAGAENVTLCDTNGSSLPSFVGEATGAVAAALAGSAEVGIHTHNDAECAVANSLVAVREGARLVQGTVNGYGERCGNANLASILPSLQLKMGFEVVSEPQLASLSRTAHVLDEICNMTPDPTQAYVGWYAFTHKAGMHGAAVEIDSRTFEHIEPELVGNQGDSTPSELSGKGTIRSQARRLGISMDDEAVERAVEDLKRQEHQGYHYEAAPASFDLLLRRAAGSYQPLLDHLLGYRVITNNKDGQVETEASIWVVENRETHVYTAMGNGPVNALDKVLRRAIQDLHPDLFSTIARIELVNYTVRILDETHGTDAIPRVLIESSDQEREWTTIGVAENVIEASWRALRDSLAYPLQSRNDRVSVE